MTSDRTPAQRRIFEQTILAFYHYDLQRRHDTAKAVESAKPSEKLAVLEEWWLEEKLLSKRCWSPGFDRYTFQQLAVWEDYSTQRDGLLYLVLLSLLRDGGFNASDAVRPPSRAHAPPSPRLLDRLRKEYYPELFTERPDAQDGRAKLVTTLFAKGSPARPDADAARFFNAITQGPKLPPGWIDRASSLRYAYPEFVEDLRSFQGAVLANLQRLDGAPGINKDTWRWLKSEFTPPIGDSWHWALEDRHSLPRGGGSLEHMAQVVAAHPNMRYAPHLHAIINHILTARWLRHYPSINTRRKIIAKPSFLKLTREDVISARRVLEGITTGKRTATMYLERAATQLGAFAYDLRSHEKVAGEIAQGMVTIFDVLLADPEIGIHEKATWAHNLGIAFRVSSKWKKAIPHYKRAAKLYAANGEHAFRADTLAYLGEAQILGGWPDAGRKTLQEALSIPATLPAAERRNRHVELLHCAVNGNASDLALDYLRKMFELDLDVDEWRYLDRAFAEISELRRGMTGPTRDL